MSLKKFILDTLERPLLGLPARMIGKLTWRHSHLLGMINPFHVPSILVDRGGSPLIARPDTYLFMNSGRKNAIRFGPEQYEPEISYLINYLIRDEDIVLDIGANVGLHTVACAAGIGGPCICIRARGRDCSQAVSQCRAERADKRDPSPLWTWSRGWQRRNGRKYRRGRPRRHQHNRGQRPSRSRAGKLPAKKDPFDGWTAWSKPWESREG